MIFGYKSSQLSRCRRLRRVKRTLKMEITFMSRTPNLGVNPWTNVTKLWSRGVNCVSGRCRYSSGDSQDDPHSDTSTFPRRRLHVGRDENVAGEDDAPRRREA